MTVFVIWEEYWGDPGPPSYSIEGVHKTKEGALASVAFRKSWPSNKCCSYSIFEFEVEE